MTAKPKRATRIERMRKARLNKRRGSIRYLFGISSGKLLRWYIHRRVP